MDSATQRLILIGTGILMVLFVVGNFVMYHMEPTSNYSLNTFNQPTIGNKNSKTEVVVFEEPKCSNCKDYNNNVFPRILKDYIDTNKIKYVVIPVSFKEGSMPATEALLCTYYQDEKNPNSKLFFKFLDYLYENQLPEKINWASDENILKMAEKADSSINLDKIKKCMERQVYFTRIKQNTAEAERVTSKNPTLPAIFVNGVRVDLSKPDNVFEAIDNAIK